MDGVKVNIDVANNMISVWNNGDGIPVEMHQGEGVYVPELIFGHLLTSSNYDDSIKKTTGGRNGYGAKLANIFSTEFTIETADGKRNKRYKQVFTNNMGKKSEPTITKCMNSENWTMVSFKPDLAKFGMKCLEDDTVALMKRRVIDLAGCLGKGVKVELDGTRVPPKTFEDYVKLYLGTSIDTTRIYEKVNDRWEVCVSLADGHFEQVSFVNNIATMKGGSHVDYITNQITSNLATIVKKKKNLDNLKPNNIKSYLWVFVNALIDNPSFDSQTKENLTTNKGSFGSTCKLTPEFLKKVAKSEVVNELLRFVDNKQNENLKKTDGKRKGKVNIPKLEDANLAASANSGDCTLILTEGDSAKALAVSCVAYVSTSNMHLFDANGVIKKYDTPEQILEDLFHLRLDFYEKRRVTLLRQLGKASLLLENKVRFIREVLRNIVVSNKKKDDLYAELNFKGFTPFPKETVLEASIAGAVDHVGREEVPSGEEKPQGNASKVVPRTEYDYLLSMAIASLTYAKMQKLQEERDAKKKEFDELTNTLSKSLWLRDLDALDHQLDEQDKRDAKDEEERRKQQEKARAKGPDGGRKARKPAKKPAAKKATVTPIDAEPMETGDVPAVPKPKGRAAAGQKKAPAKNKGKATLIDEEDELPLPLAERMAKSNFQSSQDNDDIVELLARHNIESSPEIAEEAPKKKAPAKRAAAKKKATIAEISDEDEVIEMSDDSAFEAVVAPPEEKKKGGRKPAAAKPSAGAAKKRGAAAGAASKKTAAGQKLITEVLKPVTAEASPEKKVRKMRPSPFNKKSGSVLGRMSNKEDAIEEDEAMGVGESSGEVAAAKARPQRANKKKMTYVLSDSDEEEPEDDDDATEDSDFDDDE
ncbi:DNA topoisomerase 2 [Tanacetum coccineum]